MFKLFGKKQPAQSQEVPSPQPTQEQKHPQAAALAAQFAPEEFDLFAVTGANGFGGDKVPGSEFWTATLPLVAWREEDGSIRQADACLVALADDTLMDFLKRLAPRDSIIQARVRQGLEEDSRFLLVGLPSPVMDRELKAVLDEQTREVSVQVPGLGDFVLNRSVNWYQAEGEWLGQPIQLTYDPGTQEDMTGAQDTALALTADQDNWDGRVRAYAAEHLSLLPRDEEGDEKSADLSPEEFASSLVLESIHVRPGGSFTFWLQEGDFSWQRSVRIAGSLDQGPCDAGIEE